MTAHVLGVGIGLFIIISIWTVAFLLCIISHRTQKNIGTVAIAGAAVITLILVFIPRDSVIPKKALLKLYDEFFVWRTSLVILLGLSATVGLLVIVVTHLMEPRNAQLVKQWKL